MVFYPSQKSIIWYRQEKNLTATKLQIYSISIPSMVHHHLHHHHHHHHWNAREQLRGGRRTKHELDLLLQIINNIKPRVTALLLRDCPTKQKIWTVSSKLSLVSSNPPALCSHIMPPFWPDTWSSLIQIIFKIQQRSSNRENTKCSNLLSVLSPLAFLIHVAFPLFSGSMGQWCVAVSNCEKHKLALNSLRAFSRRRQGDSEEFRGAWN